jgi:hypothetical protein
VKLDFGFAIVNVSSRRRLALMLEVKPLDRSATWPYHARLAMLTEFQKRRVALTVVGAAVAVRAAFVYRVTSVGGTARLALALAIKREFCGSTVFRTGVINVVLIALGWWLLGVLDTFQSSLRLSPTRISCGY